MTDNLNTVYLSTPGRTGTVLQGSNASTVLSELSVSGPLYATTEKLTSTLSVDGVVKFGSGVSATAGQFSSTLSVGGAAKISAVSGTAAQFSSTLSVAGATKAAHISCAGVTSSSVITCSSSAAPLSIMTSGVDTDMTVGQLRIIQLASGISLCWSSGTTLYVVNSAQSEAQPTT
jgi:hypothetical protein